MPLINIQQYEDASREKLPPSDFDSIAGGATDEITLRRNRAAYDSIHLRPRVLVDVSTRDLSSTVLGQRIAFPVMLTCAGGHVMAHPDAEMASVRAAGALDTLAALSPGASFTLEALAEAARGPLWMQQYLYKDRDLTLHMAQRAERAGYKAIVLTLDNVTPSKFERNLRHAQAGTVSTPRRSSMLNYEGYFHERGLTLPPGIGGLLNLAATWRDFAWLAGETKLPLIAKGIMTGEDAALAVEHGAKAVVVSNHGARFLDTTPATIEVLPEIVAAVAGKAEVYLDGDIRRGTDVLKALALGARAVLIGRPMFWGLAAGGEQGVRDVLAILRDELDAAMGMCGVTSAQRVPRSAVALQ